MSLFAKIQKNKRDAIYLGIIFILVFVVVYFLIVINELRDYQNLRQEIANQPNFTLVSIEVSSLTVDQFLEKQKYMTISYRDLRSPLNEALSGTKGNFGLYFEDLTTGAWIGINEREDEFVPASLLKLPNLVATLKKVEKGEIKLEDTVRLKKEDLDSRSGTLWKKGENYEITIEELLNYLIKESDNTATNTLKRRVLTTEEVIEAQFAMGLPLPDNAEEQKMSPKGYSNILRSLYLSSYLRRTFSEEALSIMTETDFDEGIPAQLPQDIKVAHKVGMAQSGGYFHDCGIVYYPNKPYLLCIMSSGSTQEEADRVISEVSKIIYDYIDKLN